MKCEHLLSFLFLLLAIVTVTDLPAGAHAREVNLSTREMVRGQMNTVTITGESASEVVLRIYLSSFPVDILIKGDRIKPN